MIIRIAPTPSLPPEPVPEPVPAPEPEIVIKEVPTPDPAVMIEDPRLTKASFGPEPAAADSAEPVQVDFRITGMPAPEAVSGDARPEGTGEAGDDPQAASRSVSPPVPLTSLSSVTFRGYTRFVAPDTGAGGADEGSSAEAPTYGQVIITGLERGGRRARLDGFGATWELPKNTAGLEVGAPLLIDGNADALTAALAALDAPAEPDRDEDGLRVAGDGAPATEAVGQPGGGGEKSDYKTPEAATPASKTEEKTPERETAETTAGCDVRVDTDLEVVFRQIRDRVTADGQIVSQTDCCDSYRPEGRFALKKSYASCPVAVDEAAERVTSPYLSFAFRRMPLRIDVSLRS